MGLTTWPTAFGRSLCTHQSAPLTRDAARPEASWMRLSVAVLALVAVHVGQVKPPGGVVVAVAVVVVRAAVVAGAADVVGALPPGGGGGTHAVTARRASSPPV